MSKLLKKGLSIFICLCMTLGIILTNMTGTFAYRDLEYNLEKDKDDVSFGTVSEVTVNSKEASVLNGLMPNGGLLLEMTGAEDTSQEIVAINIYATNWKRVGSLGFRIKYNDTKLIPSNSDGSIYQGCKVTDDFGQESEYDYDASAITSFKLDTVSSNAALKNITWLEAVGNRSAFSQIDDAYVTKSVAQNAVLNIEWSLDENLKKDGYAGIFNSSALNGESMIEEDLVFAELGVAVPVPIMTVYFKKAANQGGSGYVSLEGSDFDIFRSASLDIYPTANRAALYGFPKSLELSAASFKVQSASGTAIPNASVTVYSDADKKNQIASGTTTDSGTIELAQGGSYFNKDTVYYYTISANGYVTANGTLTGGEYTSAANPQIVSLSEKSAQSMNVELIVHDTDSVTALSGASVVFDGSSTYSTDSSGMITGLTLTEGQHSYKITKEGYDEINGTIYIKPDAGYVNGTPYSDSGYTSPLNTLSITPARANIEMALPKDGNGNVIDGAQITVSAITSGRNGWGENGVMQYTVNASQNPVTLTPKSGGSAAAATAVPVPANTEFKVEISASGYTPANTLYMKTFSASASASYYSDEAMATTAMTAAEASPTLYAMSDPIYNVNISKGSGATEKEYTATVTLKNAYASTGTFGLAYDNSVFGLDTSSSGDGFKLNEEVVHLWEPTAISDSSIVTYPAVTESDGGNVGYHVFTWEGNVDTDEGIPIFDTRSGAKTVATYKFTLKDGKTEADITPDSFTIMQYDKTELGVKQTNDTFKGDYRQAYENSFIDYFRYYDAENGTAQENPDVSNTDGLGVNRSHYLKAQGTYLNSKYSTVKADGFYQVMPLAATDETVISGTDAITTIVYENFDAHMSSLNFNVVDENGAPVSGATIKLYNESSVKDGIITDGEAPAFTLTSDEAGKANKSFSGNVTYYYTAEANGYWSKEPTKVTISGTTVSVNETVVLYTKIYNNVSLKKYTVGTGAVDEMPNAILDGGEIAYNGFDYIIHISGAPGYDFEAPAPNVVYVKSIKPGDELTGSGWTQIAYDAEINGYKIPASDISYPKTTDTLDNYGFKGYEIYVGVADKTIVEDPDTLYSVTALAGAGGKVSYDKGDALYPEGTAPDYTTEYTETKNDAGNVSGIKISDIDPAAVGKHTGSFTFEGVDGMIVEKVFINGVQVHDYDNKASFTYSGFETVLRNSTIAVTFWDNVTPSTDSVVTLSVGEKGKVSVTAPKAEDVSNAVVTYIMPGGGNVEFNAAADVGYEIQSVIQTINSTITDVTANGTEGAYTISIPASSNASIKVAFSFIGSDIPISIFVESYVESGSGTIDPLGILPYPYGAAPEFKLAAGDGYSCKNVRIDGVLTPTIDPLKYVYLIGLTKDSKIGAVFTENGIMVYGVVDWSQGASLTTANITSPGMITFERVSDGKKIVSYTTLLRSEAAFDYEIPSGEWTVTISKRGYLNYVITDLVIAEDATDPMYLGVTTGTTPKPIVPLIGETTGKGIAVSLSDAAVVVNGMRDPGKISEAQKKNANVDDDENGVVSVTTDMAYVKNNFGKRFTEISYADFCNL